MKFQDYYATLGVNRSASADEVKTAFRKLARRCHPDLNPNDRSAERRFKEINEAYEILGDPETRRKYDTLGANWKQYEQAAAAGRGPFGGRHPFAERDPFAGGSPFAGVSGSTRARRRPPLEEDGLGDLLGGASFSEFFQTFFGGASPAGGARAGAGRAPTAAGRIVEQPLELTLEEVCSGVTRRLVPTSADRRGAVSVRIPPGVADGSRIRVAGRGATGPAGAGDLMLRVRIAPHPVFARRGHDLSMRCSIPLTTAVLGGEVRLAAVDGGTVRLRVPPGTQQGQTFRIRGRGMPSPPPGGRRGDLYATAHVELPRRLSDEARRHFEALAALTEERAAPTEERAAPTEEEERDQGPRPSDATPSTA